MELAAELLISYILDIIFYIYNIISDIRYKKIVITADSLTWENLLCGKKVGNFHSLFAALKNIN